MATTEATTCDGLKDSQDRTGGGVDYDAIARVKLAEAGFEGLTDPLVVASLVPLLTQVPRR